MSFCAGPFQLSPEQIYISIVSDLLTFVLSLEVIFSSVTCGLVVRPRRTGCSTTTGSSSCRGPPRRRSSSSSIQSLARRVLQLLRQSPCRRRRRRIETLARAKSMNISREERRPARTCSPSRGATARRASTRLSQHSATIAPQPGYFPMLGYFSLTFSLNFCSGKMAPIGTRTRNCFSRVMRSAGLSIPGRECRAAYLFVHCAHFLALSMSFHYTWLIGWQQGRTVNRSTGSTCPQAIGGEEGALEAPPIGVPANAFTLYNYFTNGNRSGKADFC